MVLDLSQPGSAVDSLLYWLQVVREHAQKALDELQKEHPDVHEQLQQRANERWEGHEDRSKVSYSLVPVVVVGAKFDVFANQYESVKKKHLCQALRYVSHANGCDLVFASVREKQPAQLFKAMVSRHVLDSGSEGRVDRDHNQALNVYAGSDKFLQIGEPEVRMRVLIPVGRWHAGQGELRAAVAGAGGAAFSAEAELGTVHGCCSGRPQEVPGGEGGRDAAAKGRGTRAIQERDREGEEVREPEDGRQQSFEGPCEEEDSGREREKANSKQMKLAF